MPQFLGLDSSTQSLSAIVIDTADGRVVVDESVNFGSELPHYRSPQGVLPNPDPKVCHSDPLMWVEALDLLLGRIQARGFDWSKIAGVSGAGQQHGSVYLSRPLAEAGRFTPDRPLVDQVRPLLAHPTSPMWMDSSTGAECREIASAAGGPQRVLELSGSVAIERFTGPQIRKLYKTQPGSYERSAEIHLVSSFMAGLLAGTSAPIDLGDGAGMNLLELRTGQWNRALLDATAPGLADKLRQPVASRATVGSVAPYFVKRYGFRDGVPVVAFTGDNPSSLVGMGATAPGTRLISLGTSDTVFAAMAAPRTDPNGFGHVFGNPAGGFMSLICFTNGSLARENIARRFGLDWNAFSKAILEQTRPGNQGNFLLPYFAPETTPRVVEAGIELHGSEDFKALRDAPAAVRGVVEAQALSMRRYSDWIGHAPARLVLTGGASRSAGIQRVIADVFGAPVRVLRVANASALGAALRAAEGTSNASFEDLFAAFVALDPSVNVEPDAQARSVYAELGARFAEKVDARLSRNGA